MLVGIHVNYKDNLTPYTKRYIDILSYNNIDYKIISIQDEMFWEIFGKLDAFIFQIGHISDMLQIADSFMSIIYIYTNIPVYPNFNTFWHYDNKIKQHYLANFFKLKFVDTWVFWDKERAKEWLNTANFPLVVKLRGGAGSNNVTMLRNSYQAKRLINRAFSKGIKDSTLPSSWRVKYLPINKYLHHRMVRIKRKLLREDTNLYWCINKNYIYFQNR